MRTSCIQHLTNDPYLEIRNWQVEACEGNIKAAVCLAVCEMEYRHTTPPFPSLLSVGVFLKRVLGIYNYASLVDGLFSLEDRGFLSVTKLNPSEAQSICQQKLPQQREDTEILSCCAWCHSATWILQKHHFPLTRAEGGKTLVEICGSCHCEYHWLMGEKFFKRLPALFDAIKAHPYTRAEEEQLRYIRDVPHEHVPVPSRGEQR